MRRILGTAAIIAALAACASAAAGTAHLTTARLTVVTTTPLVVSGAQFRPNERVRVTSSQVTRIVRTTAAGTFRASFGAAVVVDRCSAFRVVAVGARGDQAVLTRPRPLCAPAA